MEQRDLMTRPEVADYLRTPINTLARWAVKGYGPPSIRVGRRCLYRRKDVLAFLERQRSNGTTA
jgi:excisionase family DNA binding protein